MTDRTYRILLVDDDADLRQSLSAYLTQVGHDVQEVSSGEEAESAFSRFEPHVTVLDYEMPGMSGLEVLKLLRRRHAVVLMLTGHQDVETAVEAMRLGAENFLQKPIDLPHLQQAVEKAAEKARLRREVADLRRRLEPGLARLLVRGAVVAAFMLAAGALGLFLGRDNAPEPVPIPIPLEEPAPVP